MPVTSPTRDEDATDDLVYRFSPHLAVHALSEQKRYKERKAEIAAWMARHSISPWKLNSFLCEAHDAHGAMIGVRMDMLTDTSGWTKEQLKRFATFQKRQTWRAQHPDPWKPKHTPSCGDVCCMSIEDVTQLEVGSGWYAKNMLATAGWVPPISDEKLKEIGRLVIEGRRRREAETLTPTPHD